jgi:hypothetical protein
VFIELKKETRVVSFLEKIKILSHWAKKKVNDK